MNKLTILSVAILLTMISLNANATTVILDSSNNWSYEIEAGAILSQPDPDNSGWIDGDGLVFYIGSPGNPTSAVVDQIGNGVRLDGNSPIDLVLDGVEFIMEATGTEQRYTAQLVWFQGYDDVGYSHSVGVPLYMDNDENYMAAVFEINAVPVPAAFWLMGSGLLGLFGFGRKNKIQVQVISA